MKALYSGVMVFRVPDRRGEQVGSVTAVLGKQPAVVEGHSDLVDGLSAAIEGTEPGRDHGHTGQ